jgi:hypothetical protein
MVGDIIADSRATSPGIRSLIRHPLIIAPIGAQRQALLTERLRRTCVLGNFQLSGPRTPFLRPRSARAFCRVRRRDCLWK